MRLLAFIVILSIGSIASAQTTKPVTEPSTKTPKPTTDAPSADQLLNSMLKPPTNTGRVLQPLPDTSKTDTGTGKAVAPNAPPAKLLREGSYIVDRTGRLTKTADGQFQFALEADGKAMQDPPLIILPNLNLAAMESAVSGASRDLRFRITGAVTEYKGHNYILLEKVVVPPDQAQQF